MIKALLVEENMISMIMLIAVSGMGAFLAARGLSLAFLWAHAELHLDYYLQCLQQYLKRWKI